MWNGYVEGGLARILLERPDCEQRQARRFLGVEDRLGGGHLHRLLTRHELSLEVAPGDDRAPADEEHDERDARRVSEQLDLALLQQVIGGHGQHERRGRDDRGRNDVSEGQQQIALGEDRPE